VTAFVASCGLPNLPTNRVAELPQMQYLVPVCRLTGRMMWDSPTMNSVSRDPQLPQRHFIWASGTSPRPAAISAASSCGADRRAAIR
jgi:hypothetical protein